VTDRGFIRHALAAFHAGTRAGTGATDTIGAVRGNGRRTAPYLAALAAAGLGGLTLTLAPSAGMPADFGAVRLELPDPPRAPAPAAPAWGAAGDGRGPGITVIDARAAPGAVSGVRFDLPGGSGSCTATLASPPASPASLPALAAAEAGLPPAGAGRINAGMSAHSWDEFHAWRVIGGCHDTVRREAALKAASTGLPPAAAAYLSHVSNLHDDVFAAVMVTRQEGNTATARQFAALRTIAAALRSQQPGDVRHDLAGAVAWTRGALQDTGPAIGIAMRWADAVGPQRLRAMSDRQVAATVRQLAAAARDTPDGYADMMQDLVALRMARDGSLAVPGHPAEDGHQPAAPLAGRLAAAMRTVGFTPRAGDFPAHPAAAWQAVPERVSGACTAAVADAIRPDLAAGATLLACSGSPGGARALFLETDGAITTVAVRGTAAGIEVSRLDSSGHHPALGGNRPAVARAAFLVEPGGSDGAGPDVHLTVNDVAALGLMRR